MDKGLLGMCLNEHRLIKIPPHLAYGDKEAGNLYCIFSSFKLRSIFLHGNIILKNYSINNFRQIIDSYLAIQCHDPF